MPSKLNPEWARLKQAEAAGMDVPDSWSLHIPKYLPGSMEVQTPLKYPEIPGNTGNIVKAMEEACVEGSRRAYCVEIDLELCPQIFKVDVERRADH